MNDYTKGKWKVFNLTDVFTDTNPFGKGDIHICDCNVHRKILGTDKELPLSEAEANAHLIAAAKDLLAACRMLIRAVDRGNFDKNGFLTIHPKSPFIETFEQVIAKAVPTSQVKEIEK